MGDWIDEFGWYDDLDRQEQEEQRKALRAKLLTPPEPAQKPMHPELRKMWEDHFDKCFREFSAAQPAPVQEPVAWMFEDDEDNGHKTFRQTPPSPEVVAYLAKWNRPAWVPIYTTPPAAQRQWRGLTDKEFEDIIMSAPNATVPVVLWQLIQDKIKEKNQ